MNTILKYISFLFKAETYSLQNFAIVMIVLMNIQYIPLESRAGVSPLKVALMAIAPFILLRYIRVTKALAIALLYMLYIFITAYALHPSTFRASTVIYLFMFVTSYVAFYNFVYVNKVFTLDFFLSFVKKFIYVWVGVLIVQQVFLLIGIKYFPLINLCQILDRGIGANSLSYEPSSFARTLAVLYYAYIKCNEYRQGRPIDFIQIFNPEHRRVTLLFLWSILTMGSGTAFVCMAVVAIYFLRGRAMILSIPILIGSFFILQESENESFHRAQKAALITMTGDRKAIVEADGSAAVRIKPMLNTFTIDLFKTSTWIGEGCDAGIKKGHYSDNQYIGEINNYGLIAYILGLTLVFSCSITFLSIPTIMYFLGIGGGTGNIAYTWGILMIFTCVRFFKEEQLKFH